MSAAVSTSARSHSHTPGRAPWPSAFGAAASLAAMLLWLYYSAQIFLLGAEFTACCGGVRDHAT